MVKHPYGGGVNVTARAIETSETERHTEPAHCLQERCRWFPSTPPRKVCRCHFAHVSGGRLRSLLHRGSPHVPRTQSSKERSLPTKRSDIMAVSEAKKKVTGMWRVPRPGSNIRKGVLIRSVRAEGSHGNLARSLTACPVIPFSQPDHPGFHACRLRRLPRRDTLSIKDHLRVTRVSRLRAEATAIPARRPRTGR